MPIPKATNERIKRAYFEWFQNARGCSPVTANHVGRAIRAFETFTGFKDFRTFDRHQAMAFRKHLSDDPSDATGKILSLATQHATLLHVRAFFRWLSDQSSYRRAVKASDADYLTLSKGERAIAKRRSAPKPFPSCEQVVQALRTLPFDTDLQKRDRALMAFLLLTGARVGSVCSLKLKHIDLSASCAFLDAAEVKTKFSKTFRVWFFPVGALALEIFTEWVTYLRTDLGRRDDDPLFPATAQTVGANLQFTNAGLSRDHWQTPDSIRDILRAKFMAAGLPYFYPHAFRDTLARLGEQLCRTAEEFKAWSQNLGHESPLTTFRSYGEVPSDRQAEIIESLADRKLHDVAGDGARLLQAFSEIIEREKSRLT